MYLQISAVIAKFTKQLITDQVIIVTQYVPSSYRPIIYHSTTDLEIMIALDCSELIQVCVSYHLCMHIALFLLH